MPSEAEIKAADAAIVDCSRAMSSLRDDGARRYAVAALEAAEKVRVTEKADKDEAGK